MRNEEMNSEKVRAFRVLHLCGDPELTAELWSELVSRTRRVVDVAVATSAEEVLTVIEDYDIVVVSSSSDWEELSRAGIGSKLVNFQGLPEALAASRPNLRNSQSSSKTNKGGN